MKLYILTAVGALLLAGCNNDHAKSEIGSNKSTPSQVHYSSKVLGDLDSDILNLQGTEPTSIRVENLAREAVFASETLLKKMNIKDLKHLISFAETQLSEGNTTAVLSNGDEVRLGIFSVDASTQSLGMTIQGRTALFDFDLPHIVESSTGSKKPNFNKSQVDVSLSVSIFPHLSLTQVQVDFDGLAYSVSKHSDKISYRETFKVNSGQYQTNFVVYDLNKAQVGGAFDGIQYNLSYDSKTDSLFK